MDLSTQQARRYESAIKTYRYLRIAIVALVLYLGTAVVIEMATGDGWLGSISAYYYTPVRSVLVGTLSVMAIGLIAIKGRDGNGEDFMLNVAGMLAPVVALVPTPVDPGALAQADGVPLTPCAHGRKRCVPDEFIPNVDNNVQTLLIVGAVALVVVWLLAVKQGRLTHYLTALLACLGVYAAFTVWFLLDVEHFPLLAHYVAAIPMFGLICFVAIRNAKSIDSADNDRRKYPGLSAGTYRRLYTLIAWCIGIATGLTALAGLANYLNDIDPFPHWVFVVEAALLALFAAFWVLQTAQFWHEGLPDEDE